MTKNTAAIEEIKLTSDPSGHILYSISWIEMVREILGLYEDERTDKDSLQVELFENLDRVGTNCTPPSAVEY